MATPLYMIQPSFVGGEISPDVASRVDLDKYQMALLQAENTIIRPYGAVRKRTGTIYCGECKYPDKTVRLHKFDFTVDISYLLEFGNEYLRIWRNGRYLKIEIETPYVSEELDKLRFIQSRDVLYICSGSYPVHKLIRYTEKNWKFVEIEWNIPPFGDINKDDSLAITPSGISGNITLTASKTLFTEDMAGDWLKLEQIMSGTSVSITGNGEDNEAVSGHIMVGDTWKIITHGTWTGSVRIEQSSDSGKTWKQIRHYDSKGDYNPSESGSVDQYVLMRICVKAGSACTATLSSYVYTHTGYVQIKTVVNENTATAEVKKILGSTEPVIDWYMAAWNIRDGYPNCACFFQDRLCLGGSDQYPQRIWMSRTGDYENFEVEKASGEVLDDSGITADLLSSKAYMINHMNAGSDLVITTEGNEWTIAGNETVTPSSITPRNQQNFGSNDIEPVRVGNRLIYIQRRGSIVRDMGYNYDTDSYVGSDLTLLAKHMIENRKIVDGTYAQEPDSLIYFVRDDGTIICLTYNFDQKVFGWSRLTTDGAFENVVSCQQGNNDVVYVVAKREINGETVRYIEQFAANSNSDNQQDYYMTDSSVIYNLDKPASEITGLSNLEGKKVHVMADGYFYEDLTVTNGAVTLPQNAKRITIGLPVTMILEQPNFDIGNNANGTIQGRMKQISSCILRLHNSFGGEIGPNKESLDKIIYNKGVLELGQNVLYSGDLKVTLFSGGFDLLGRIYIKHDKPYPMTISAIIRVVTIGG